MSLFHRYTLDDAPDDAKQLLESIQKSYGFIPELFSYMAEAPLTIDAYLHLNTLIEKSAFSAEETQIALLTVSRENHCDFCSVAHEAMARQAGVDRDTLESIKSGNTPEAPRLQALVTLARQLTEKRGWVDESDIQSFLDAGFEKAQVMELILILSLKTLSNYINHLSHPEPNPELVELAQS